MSRYLADNSVLQRLPRSTAVQAAIGSLLDAEQELCCCALSLDEFAYSTRSAAEHAEASRRLRTSFLYLPLSPDIDQLILDIRAALWNAGTSGAAGVIDVALAATAVRGVGAPTWCNGSQPAASRRSPSLIPEANSRFRPNPRSAGIAVSDGSSPPRTPISGNSPP